MLPHSTLAAGGAAQALQSLLHRSCSCAASSLLAAVTTVSKPATNQRSCFSTSSTTAAAAPSVQGDSQPSTSSSSSSPRVTRAPITKAEYVSTGKMPTWGHYSSLDWWQGSRSMDRPLYQAMKTHPCFQAGKLDVARVLRRHNNSLPDLRGQIILARVLRVDSDYVNVDPGFYGVSEIPRADISIGDVWTEDGTLPDRPSADDVRPGDLLRLRVDSTFTPYGDMQLESVKRDPAEHKKRVWQALKEIKEQGRPVQGRVLNSCRGGYAVGIAGFVALLPHGRVTLSTSYKIGMLESFYLNTMEDSKYRIVVSDAQSNYRPK